MILYHRTAAADAILRDGFRDGAGWYGLPPETAPGVFVSDVPLDLNEGAKGDQLLEVDLAAEQDIGDYELVQPASGYREWCVPADLLNRHGRVRLLSQDDEDAIGDRLWRQRWGSSDDTR